MSGPLSAPWTDVGRLQSDISNIESQLYRKADSHEVSSLNSKVDGLEREVRELSTTCDGLRFELSQLQEGYREVLNILSTMTEVVRG